MRAGFASRMLRGTRGSGQCGVGGEGLFGAGPVLEGRHIGEDRCRPAVSQLSLPSLLFLFVFCKGAGNCAWSRGCCEGLPTTSFGVTGMGAWDPDCRFIVTNKCSPEA